MVLAHPRLQVNVAKQRPNHDKIKPASDFFNSLSG
jgi:hypothetical protein